MRSTRLPLWALTGFGIMLATAVATDSLLHPLAPSILESWGYASRHLDSEGWRILVSPFLTHGGWHAWFAHVPTLRVHGC